MSEQLSNYIHYVESAYSQLEESLNKEGMNHNLTFYDLVTDNLDIRNILVHKDPFYRIISSLEEQEHARSVKEKIHSKFVNKFWSTIQTV